MTSLDPSPQIVSRLAATLCAVWLIAGSATTTAFAEEEETRLTQPVLEPIADEIDQKLQEETEDLADDVPEDRATILGMTVREGRRSRAIVKDVALGSPAAKAGIREGDAIISIAGFRGESYDEWLEGVARIIRDTPDGETVPVVIRRRDKRVSVPVRTLIASPAEGSLATGRTVVKVPDAVPGVASQPAQPQVNAGVGGSDDDIFINNSDFFGDGALGGRPNERAIAHLYLIPVAQQPQQTTGAGAAGATNNPALDAGPAIDASGADVRQSSAGGFGQGRGTAAARIGLAGFRNREQGMLVMVDVGSLPPGNYTVAIADPGTIPGGAGAPSGNPFLPPGSNQAAPAAAPVEQNLRPAQPAPARRPAAVGGQRRERLQQPLRQQLPDDDEQDTGLSAPATGEVNPLSAPATGEVNPLSAPATGQINELSATPTGQVNPPARQPAGATRPPGTLAQVGLLTVDQSGTGRLQQVVEAMQVADVVGQALVIFTDAVPPTNTIPPGGNVVDTATPQQDAPRDATAPLGPIPVAAGLIRITSTSGNDGEVNAAAANEPAASGVGAEQAPPQ